MNKILLCLCLFFISCSDFGVDNSESSELEGSWIGSNISIIDGTYPQNEYTFTFTNDNCEINGIIHYDVDMDEYGTIPIIGSSTFTTNTQVEPHEIDMTFISYEIGDNYYGYLGCIGDYDVCDYDYDGWTARGIYQIDGDSLKFALPYWWGTVRPVDFTIENGAQVYLLVRD